MGEIQCQCDIAILEINIRHFSFFIMIIASPPHPPKKRMCPFPKCSLKYGEVALRGFTASTPPQYHCSICICQTWTPELIHRRVSFPAIAVAGVDTCVVFGIGEIPGWYPGGSFAKAKWP